MICYNISHLCTSRVLSPYRCRLPASLIVDDAFHALTAWWHPITTFNNSKEYISVNLEFKPSLLMIETPIFLKMLSFSLSKIIRLAIAANLVTQSPLAHSFLPHGNEERAPSSLSSFIASEGPLALQGILDNIGSGGAMAPGVEAGLVVASPSKANPDC